MVLDGFIMYAYNANMFIRDNAMSIILANMPPGTIISVERGLYRHFGVLAELVAGRERQVLSFNPGPVGRQVVEESLSAFCRAEVPRIEPPFSQVAPSVVLARARSGQHPDYSWMFFNCEHFVRFAHGLRPESPQAATWGMLLGMAAIVYTFKFSSARPV